LLHPGLPLKLTTNNSLYRGNYDSKVISVDEEEKQLIISAPLQNGRLILLPVGTILKVRPAGSSEDLGFQAEILSRTFQPQRTLTVTLPHAISHSGRAKPQDGSQAHGHTARVIAVTSGKGGVGKTTVSINMGVALSRMGYRVCLIDVDLGTANIEFLLNLNTPYNIAHLLNGEKSIDEIIIEGPENLLILPGASGLDRLANLSQWQFTRLVNSFNKLDQISDIVILDTGAGISANVTNFLLAADEIVVVTTPDPHAVLDAYALIKTAAQKKEGLQIKLIVNMVEKASDEARVKLNLLKACQDHLSQPLTYLGAIPESKTVIRSIREMDPFISRYPDCSAATRLQGICSRLIGTKTKVEQEPEKKGLHRFIGELQKLFNASGE